MKKNKKIISILLTLTFLMSLVIPSAVFAAESAVISGGYTYIKAEDNKALGNISIYKHADLANVTGSVYIEVKLPDTVDVDAISSVYGTYTQPSDATSFLVTLTDSEFNVRTNADPVTINLSNVDIKSGTTGDIVAKVKVWNYTGSVVAWEKTAEVVVGKITSGGNTSVSVASTKTLAVGANKEGSKITIEEATPGALAAGSDKEVMLVITTSGVRWNTASTTYAGTAVTLGTGSITDADSKSLKLPITAASSSMPGKIEVTPRLDVEPGTTGEVTIEVSGDDVKAAKVVVGKVGAGDVAITVENDGKDTIRVGRKATAATFDEAKIKLDPATTLKNGDYFTVTLPKGLKWDSGATAITENGANVEFVRLINDDRTAWFNVTGSQSDDIELTVFRVIADYDAPVGDLKVTFDGNVKGEAKIGAVKNILTMSAEKKNIPLRGSDVKVGNIKIVEGGAGALVTTDGTSTSTAGDRAYLDLVLPMGVTFAKTPKVERISGDISVSVNGLVDNGSKLRLNVTSASNLASTIELQDVYLNVDNRASLGDITAKWGAEYNEASMNALGSFTLATIVSPTAAKAQFVIGQNSFVVNGETKTMDVAPYISNDRTYMPLRFAANALGVSDDNIIWNAAEQSAVIIKGDKVVKFVVGSNAMYLGGITVTMDVAPEIKDGRVMLPVGWLGKALNATISWDQATQTASFEVQ